MVFSDGHSSAEKEVIEKMGEEFAIEYKLDGERVQLHIEGEKIEDLVLFWLSLGINMIEAER